MTQKVLSLNGGLVPTQITPLTSSVGASSSGSVIALNSSGVIDSTMLPAPGNAFAEDPATTTGLTWGYTGGTVINNGTPTTVAAGTLTLAATATTYVSVTPTGSLVTSTAGWVAGAFPLRKLVTSSTAITTDTDERGYFFVTTTGKDYDIAGGIPGQPTASQVVARYTLARAIQFPLNFSGSYWSAGTAPAAAATFTVESNGTSIGTINFAASATTATFTTVSTGVTDIAAGAILTIVAPSTADTALANASGTLAGSLQ